MPYPTVLHTKAFDGLHLSLQGGEGIRRSTAKTGGRNQGQGRRGMVHVPFDTYGCLFDRLSLLGCHVGAAAGCATAGTGGIRESGKYSSTCTYTHIIKYIFLYMQYSGYLISVISGNFSKPATLSSTLIDQVYVYITA